MLSIRKECAKIIEAVAAFDLSAPLLSIEPYGNGHINDTFLLECGAKIVVKRYILQRINHDIFKNPECLMNNINSVLSFLKHKLEEESQNKNGQALNIIPTKDGKICYEDSIGSFWRVYDFVENTVCLEYVRKPEDFYNCAVAFGNFQRLLAGFDAKILYETIKDFHNTPVRFSELKKAIQADACNRAVYAKAEIEYALSLEFETTILFDMQKNGKLSMQVTHNDTKLNSVLLDKKTKKAACIIDLDTVMPGLAITDFGDAIRFGANTGAEDEQNLDKVFMDLELFKVYTKGFIVGRGETLSRAEMEMLPMAAKMMTFECGMRFLTDYLNGDNYFKIHRENHNLDRARTQLKLVRDMDKKWDAMMNIVSQ